jgi:hypothetical protein
MGETPFFLVYGTEAVLPSELSLGSPRVALYDEANQDDLRRDDLDYLEERRRRAALRAARLIKISFAEMTSTTWKSEGGARPSEPRATSRACGATISATSGPDHSASTTSSYAASKRVLGLSKLSPMWEGPYKVIGVPRPGSVRLSTEDGTELPNPWNIEHLRRFYP